MRGPCDFLHIVMHYLAVKWSNPSCQLCLPFPFENFHMPLRTEKAIEFNWNRFFRKHPSRADDPWHISNASFADLANTFTTAARQLCSVSIVFHAWLTPSSCCLQRTLMKNIVEIHCKLIRYRYACLTWYTRNRIGSSFIRSRIGLCHSKAVMDI